MTCRNRGVVDKDGIGRVEIDNGRVNRGGVGTGREDGPFCRDLVLHRAGMIAWV